MCQGKNLDGSVTLHKEETLETKSIYDQLSYAQKYSERDCPKKPNSPLTAIYNLKVEEVTRFLFLIEKRTASSLLNDILLKNYRR